MGPVKLHSYHRVPDACRGIAKRLKLDRHEKNTAGAASTVYASQDRIATGSTLQAMRQIMCKVHDLAYSQAG
jgi:hypothetical protein